jgi:hypothetical protein
MSQPPGKPNCPDQYDIHPVTIGPAHSRVRGYRAEDFQDAFARYLPADPASAHRSAAQNWSSAQNCRHASARKRANKQKASKQSGLRSGGSREDHRMGSAMRTGTPKKEDQIKCWIASEGHLWMRDYFDRLPPRIRQRLRQSPFNLCPACLVTRELNGLPTLPYSITRT